MTAVMNGLVLMGVSVDLYLARASGIHLTSLHEQIRVHDLRARSVMRAVPQLRRMLKRNPPDTLLSSMSHANVAAWLATRFMHGQRPRLVLSERMSLEARATFYASFAERIIKALMPMMFSQADAVVVPAASMIPALLHHSRVHSSRFRFIPNPLHAQARNAHKGNWELGEELGRQGKRIVLAVGRLSAVKDYPTLIRAFAGLPQEYKAHLVILGEGEERAALTSLIKALGVSDKVSLPGYCANPLSAMESCAVYVLSSIYEGLPNALLQALSVGAPIVSTDCPTGPRELLDGGRLGTMVPVGSVAAMRKAIGGALGSRLARQPVDLSAYSTETVVKQYEAVLFPPRAD